MKRQIEDNPYQAKKAQTSNLLSVIKNKQWGLIEFYLDEAKKIDNQEYPLHKLCNDSETPIEVIKAIFNAYPDAAMAQNKRKFTPLALAIECEFDAAVKYLANVYPDAIILSDNSNMSSMHSAVDCLISHTVVNHIVDAHPESLFVPNSKGVSAFHEFFRYWNSFLRVMLDDSDSYRRGMSDLMHGCGDWKLEDICKKTLLFLNAASELSENVWNDLPVHSSCRFESCTWSFTSLLLRLHPGQALMKDEHGNLPIHIILSSEEVTDEGALECIYCGNLSNELIRVNTEDGGNYNFCDLCQDEIDDLNVVNMQNMKSVEKVYNIVKELLKLTPFMASIRDCHGRYPLHVAIDNHHSFDIIQLVFDTYSDVGKVRHGNTRLIPYMKAAVGDWESEYDQINSIYYLLREDPPLVSEF